MLTRHRARYIATAAHQLPRQQAIRLRDSAHSTVAGHLLFTLLAEGFWSALTVRALTGMGFVSRVTPVQTALRNCTGDEGGPFGFGEDCYRKALGIIRDRPRQYDPE
ncbi:MAG TPA: hypothetical protein VKV41_24935, partial [Methylomirabilota bacterium]|nr:hypothetical protein [Methylomirabilota bacterium]